MSRESRSGMTIEKFASRADSDAERWIHEGWDMARKEHEQAFGSIEIRHAAERASHEVLTKDIAGRGSVLLERRDELESRLSELGFSPAEHLRQIAHGKIDLAWAIALFVLNAALAVFVLLAFGPAWLAMLFALLVLASALPVEEFFQAYEERAVLREAVFLALSVLGLGAQFWLGTVRGLLLAALTPADAGPVTHFFAGAAPVLKVTLGVFSVVSEVLCGYKLHRARAQLFSATARAVRKRDSHNGELACLYAAQEAAKVAPEIRRNYREIGARQYLAWTAGERERADANHLRRAVKWALIVLLILAVLLLLVPRSSAAPVPGRSFVVLVDLSKSVPLADCRANLQAVSSVIGRLQPTDRIVVIGITDSFGNPAILFDRTLSAGGYLDLNLRAGREELAWEWGRISEGLHPTYMRTDILGALSVVGDLGGLSPANMCLIVLSDLRQNSPDLNIETVKRIQVGGTLQRLREAGRVPSLKGARVFLLGVDPNGKSVAYFTTLKAFWFGFFRQAGADVDCFTIDRRLPEF